MDSATSRLQNAAQRQPAHSFLPNARDFSIIGAVFNEIRGDFHHHAERAAALDDLKPYISEAAMHDSLARFPPPLCHPKTREKVLKVITDWIDGSYPRQRIMWLNGPAGAGKSAIAQTIAERYKDSRLAASFFFLRNRPDRGVVDRLFLTLAWQLARSIPETRPYIESALQVEPLLYAKSINIQFNQLIGKVFENLLRDQPDLRPKKSLVIIDGVDECVSEQDQKLFLTLIADALALTNIPLRFLICSRPEAHIKETFDMEIMQNITRAIVLDEKFAPNDDIQRYLEDEFFRIFTKRNISSFPSDEDVHHLVSKASGQFIYASTVIKFVDDDDCHPKEQLAIILKLRPVTSSSPYTQLDQLYIQILSRQPDVKFLRDVFVLIIALGRPDIKFICRRRRICEDNLRLKLRKMYSLLQISDSYVTTYHRSLHDFFQDKKRAGKYHIHPIRVALVRLPGTIRRFMNSELLTLLGTFWSRFVVGLFILSISPGILVYFIILAVIFCTKWLHDMTK
ncbi:hypothetical protein F5887DRAFT_1072572 [Amanita rubescens]|nr:hypothetical protein F5887DRAFT_1072572 [Amanita rubescens]